MVERERVGGHTAVMSKVRAKAIVVVTLEIPVGDVWGEDCPVGQVHKQALDSLRGILFRTSIAGNKGTATKPTLPAGTRIIGEPKVKQIITEEDR